MSTAPADDPRPRDPRPRELPPDCACGRPDAAPVHIRRRDCLIVTHREGPMRAGHVTIPPAVAVPIVVESRWTIAARVLSIIRDIVVILLVAALLYFGSAILSAAKTTPPGDGVSGGTAVVPCRSPEVDPWGTFCPVTPGG